MSAVTGTRARPAGVRGAPLMCFLRLLVRRRAHILSPVHQASTKGAVMSEVERKKTGGLTALGVISVNLGALFLIAGAWGLLAGPDLAKQPKNAPVILTQMGLSFCYADAGMNVLLAGTLFAAGVGLLRLKTWGRKLAIGYSLARIVWSIVAATMAFLGPYMYRPKAEGLREEFASFLRDYYPGIALTQIIAGAVISVVLPVILLCLLSRKNYKDNLT
jgi:hypothetical protein